MLCRWCNARKEGQVMPEARATLYKKYCSKICMQAHKIDKKQNKETK